MAGWRTLRWSGMEWRVKDSAGELMGPGRNRFSGDPQRSVFVDPQGRLHLRIASERRASGEVVWSCSEVVSLGSFGHGTYRWTLASPVVADPRVVFGLFTWDDTSEAEHHREIDIELISTWGETNSLRNAQYVLQPYERKGHLHRWEMPFTGPAASASTHAFTWRPDRIEFLSRVGDSTAIRGEAAALQSWVCRAAGIPSPGRENVRINLWLIKPLPAGTPEPEVILSRFEFLPLPAR